MALLVVEEDIYIYNNDNDDDDDVFCIDSSSSDMCIYINNVIGDRNDCGTSGIKEKNKDDEKVKDDYEDDKDETNNDYIPNYKEGFEFYNKSKDKWINNLQGNVQFVKTLDGAFDSENECNISSDDDNTNIIWELKLLSSLVLTYGFFIFVYCHFLNIQLF
jgi:hypothetical protein